MEASQLDNQKSNQPVDELCQEDAPDNEGMGQSQMEESATGHSAQTTVPQEVKTGKRELEEDEIRKQKPGESDSQRSLGNKLTLSHVINFVMQFLQAMLMNLFVRNLNR